MRRVTARDVATLVGCSVSSVSLVVNGRDSGHINPRLRAQILAAIAELDYRPNETARGLAVRRPSRVALVCPDIRNPFFGILFHGLVEGLAGEYGVDLKVGSGGGDYDAEDVRDAQAANIAGIVLANPAISVINSFRSNGPTVLVDSPASHTGLPRVNLDLETGARELAAHLTGLGHRSIAYLDYSAPKDTFSQRFRLLETYLESGGASIVHRAVATQISVASGRSEFEESWPRWRATGVTAVVAADDVLAYGVLAGASRLGIRIPDQLSVAGFNDLTYSALTDPPLTSVAFDAHDMGRTAGVMLRALINGGQVEERLSATWLVPRTSTAAAVRG